MAAQKWVYVVLLVLLSSGISSAYRAPKFKDPKDDDSYVMDHVVPPKDDDSKDEPVPKNVNAEDHLTAAGGTDDDTCLDCFVLPPKTPAWSPQPANQQPCSATPEPVFSNPLPGYGTPQPIVTPQPGYSNPQPGFSTPQPGYVPPQPIGDPRPSYPGYGIIGGPQDGLAQPVIGNPQPSYPGYGDPQPGFGTPQPVYPGYGAPQPSYPGYATPQPSFGPPVLSTPPGFDRPCPPPWFGYGSPVSYTDSIDALTGAFRELTDAVKKYTSMSISHSNTKH